jgi:hypothetical protein
LRDGHGDGGEVLSKEKMRADFIYISGELRPSVRRISLAAVPFWILQALWQRPNS